VHDPPLRPRSVERQRNGGSIIVADRMAPLRGGSSESASSSVGSHISHRDSRSINRVRLGISSAGRADGADNQEDDSDDTE
jgi:hypothetical protein